MPQSHPRKPIGNFFIMRDLQLRLTFKIVLSVILATIVFAATLLVTYHLTYSSAAFYQVTLSTGSPEIGDRLEIVSIILPSMLISAVVNILLAFCVGLYASRKYAVPIYKLERWAGLLNGGDLTATLRFREKDEMKDLSESCNRATKQMRERFLEIKNAMAELEKKGALSDEAAKVKTIVGKLELESHAIDIHTTYSEISEAGEVKPLGRPEDGTPQS